MPMTNKREKCSLVNMTCTRCTPSEQQNMTCFSFKTKAVPEKNFSILIYIFLQIFRQTDKK